MNTITIGFFAIMVLALVGAALSGEKAYRQNIRLYRKEKGGVYFDINRQLSFFSILKTGIALLILKIIYDRYTAWRNKNDQES